MNPSSLIFITAVSLRTAYETALSLLYSTSGSSAYFVVPTLWCTISYQMILQPFYVNIITIPRFTEMRNDEKLSMFCSKI
mmetsp:Transcript_6405/g.12076  ORF Transcript_6405/g.12076 Transcript_6405/m.12076 type:complete len:80 (+) Transcript_6405:96-335(+)